jgi:CHAT domain
LSNNISNQSKIPWWFWVANMTEANTNTKIASSPLASGDQPAIPGILLAFANANEGEPEYLRNLALELDDLRKAMREAHRKSLCEVIERANVTLNQIVDVFLDPDHHNQIAILHYGGHADGKTLTMEEPLTSQLQSANATGLAEFLAQQRGLQLVFLNGCATRDQVNSLLSAGVLAIIATSRSIHDDTARFFATAFYTSLGAGKSIQEAFKSASGAVKASNGTLRRHLLIAAEEDAAPGPLPWELYVSPNGNGLDWNLPDAVKDPLAFIPPLPKAALPESPYRGLAWFTREHAEVFFGRSQDIRNLYNLVTQTDASIILLYGQSGVGKSSLLEAGFLPRLESIFEVRYERLTPNTRPPQVLAKALKQQGWAGYEAIRGQPIILVLDQLEEVFTHVSQPQLDDLLMWLDENLNDPVTRPKGKLILGFRKEYLSEVEGALSSRGFKHEKVLLAPLSRDDVVEVIEGPVRSTRLNAQFKLAIQSDLPTRIAIDLLDRDSPLAPTLQILLTYMWAEARKKYPDAPVFDTDLYESLESKYAHLEPFLDEQFKKLETWDNQVVESGLTLDLLAFYTTPLGTAEPHTDAELEATYQHCIGKVRELVEQAKDLYLLADMRDETRPKIIRLSHDTLAPLVRKRYSESIRPGQRARRLLENRAAEWKDGQIGSFIEATDLQIVERGLSGMRATTTDEERLLLGSRQRHHEQEEQWRQTETRLKENTENLNQMHMKLVEETHHLKLTRWLLWGVILVLAAVTGFVIVLLRPPALT